MIRGDTDTLDSWKHAETKSTFFSVPRAVQITVLVFGTVMFLVWCGCYFMSAKPLQNAAAISQFSSDGMLPPTLSPHHYNLTLQFYMPPQYDFTTKGSVQIFVECLQQTQVIFLHARDLKVHHMTVTPINNITAFKVNVSQLPLQQMLIVEVERPLLAHSKYVLDISFSGHITNLSMGLYRSRTSAQSWIASTQFQPSDARRVFPCFDEPGWKSTFSLHLIHRRSDVSLSNMPPRANRSIDEDWQVVSFEKTPKMSTYLLAFVVGDIQPSIQIPQPKVQVWSRRDMVSYGDYALGIAPKILKFLEEYIEVPYSMPKLDLVAIPNFLHAAMENWALVTFDESALLYDPKKSSTQNKVTVTLTIAHELAHQWFGNLVTPTWWDNLWLNEGFATYYEYLAVDSLEPNWNSIHLFLTSVDEVMETDSLLSTRAMGASVHPDQVLEHFDEISYLKGGAIVRMLEHFIGYENFHQGLKNYLWKYSYKSATENNLWQNFNLWNRNPFGVREVMRRWTHQSGYPVIHLIRNYENQSAVLSQEAFTLEDSEESSSSTWVVPVTYTNGQELDWRTGTDFWLNKTSDILTDVPGNETWIMANIQHVGYYRVNYDPTNWEMILEQLFENHTAIHVINRAQVLSDALNLARSDRVEYSFALNVTKYLLLEEEYLPWRAAFSAFKYFDLMLSKTPGYQSWQVYLMSLMSPLYSSLGWNAQLPESDILQRFLRKHILKWSCDYGNEDCIKNSLILFRQWKEDLIQNDTLWADEREIVLCTGIAKGQTEDWEFVWTRYVKENFKAEKNLLLKSLACTKETRLLRKLLKKSMLSDSGIALQDGSDVFIYVADNFYGRDVVYDFFKNHVEEISLRFGSFSFGGGNIVNRVTAALKTENELEDLKSILKGRTSSIQGIHTALKKALFRTQSNMYWMNNKYDEIQEWLTQNTFSKIVSVM